MSRVMLYAYVAADFGDGFPPDPLAAAQTAVSLPVSLARGAEAVPLSVEGGHLHAPARIAGLDLEAGAPVAPTWVLVDAARGLRLTGYQLGEGPDMVPVIGAALPLRPGQSLDLSLPVEDAAGGAPFLGGFAAGARILTQSGKRPIEDVAVGEAVWTEAQGFQPVLWHGVQTLPARAQAAPVRVRRGVLGLTDDLLISAGQCLRVDSASGPVLVPAAALAERGLAVLDFGALIAWHQILLPRHAVMLVQGLGCESLWEAGLGKGRRPAGWPADHPPSAEAALPRLTLAEARALSF